MTEALILVQNYRTCSDTYDKPLLDLECRIQRWV